LISKGFGTFHLLPLGGSKGDLGEVGKVGKVLFCLLKGSLMEKFVELLIVGIGAFILVLIIGALGGLPVWLLWNWLMPKIFSLPTISFLEAIGLSILASCLFQSQKSSKD
jgi:hypothetical protein